ncbi:hypothetical protein RRF57_004757 [Xylaria bambusicola]|uniref:ATP-dependent DNA helicase n=1 Tax=Xylaria bambusicola TaxID=326684 RepID=A0AAN7Z457_9PEZI
MSHGVGVLAYGTLLGEFLSEKWLDRPEPEDINALNSSLRKYLRFIRVAGGWETFQGLLRALSTISHTHNVSIPAVATRYVLDIRTVSAVIVGCRLTSDSSKYAERNLEVFSFKLSKDDHAVIRKAQQALLDIPGGCGDEYRRPPYLTAAGDLSHHIKITQSDELREAISTGKRIEYSTDSPWEPIAGYCRAVRTGNHICISGTTANSPSSLSLPVLGEYSARSQTVAILDIIRRALKALGGTLSDVVRTRIIVGNEADCEEVSRAHGWVFQCEGVRPSNTLLVASLIGPEYLVEIEVEARLGFDGVILTIAIAAGFLSNLFSGPESAGASARTETELAADIGTIDESEDIQPRRKRPRIHDESLSGPEVVSLLSSDEEYSNPSRQTSHLPSHPTLHQHHDLDSFPNAYGSGKAIPLHLQPHAESPDTESIFHTGQDTAARDIKRVMNMLAQPDQQIEAIETGLSLGIPPTVPSSSNAMSHSMDVGSNGQARLGIPIKEPALCPEQAELVDIILSGRNVFYTGSAGCGKSTVLKAFTRRFRDQGLQVDIVAPTGISALGVGGSTTFVYAGWSLSSFKRPLDKVRQGAHGKYVRKRLKSTDVLVIDEISMVENFHFERLNAVMQEARSSYEPFGGVQVVVTGDFHQLPPVKPFETCLQCGEDLVSNRSQESYSCRRHGTFHDEDKWAFKSEAWGLCNFVYFHLKTIHRQNDETFIKILQKCRIGEALTGADTDILMNHPCRTANATKLYARREEVRRHNQIRFDKLLSEKYTFTCMDAFDLNPEHEILRGIIGAPPTEA